MKKVYYSLIAVAMVALAASCNQVSFKKSDSGMLYKIFSSGKDSVVKEGEWLKLHFTQKLNDSVVQTSFGKMPVYVKIQKNPRGAYSPVEIFPLLRKGDSLVTIMLVDSMLSKHIMEELPPNMKRSDRIVFNIRVVDVFRSDSISQADQAQEQIKDRPRQMKEQEEQAEKMRTQMLEQRAKTEKEYEDNGEAAKGIQSMKDFLTGKNITAQQVGKGTFVVVKDPGTGEQAAPGKYVTVKYIGSLVRKDSIFDQGTFERKLGQGELISGMEEGLESFKKGGKGVLYIPGFRAYGKSHPRFQPFEAMKFDIEVLNVSDTATQQVGP